MSQILTADRNTVAQSDAVIHVESEDTVTTVLSPTST